MAGRRRHGFRRSDHDKPVALGRRVSPSHGARLDPVGAADSGCPSTRPEKRVSFCPRCPVRRKPTRSHVGASLKTVKRTSPA